MACERSVWLSARKISDSLISRQLGKKTPSRSINYDFSEKSDDVKHVTCCFFTFNLSSNIHQELTTVTKIDRLYRKKNISRFLTYLFIDNGCIVVELNCKAFGT